MKPITLSQANLTESLKAHSGSYFIIEEDITIPAGDIVFPENSILEFRGGSFVSPTDTGSKRTVQLNGSTVYAPVYCLFSRSVNVSGFGNSVVHADWFNDIDDEEGDEVFINRAIVSAHGTPVTLESRTYWLKNAIVIPNIGLFTSQTFHSPGVLRLVKDESIADPAAIEILGHYVRMDINLIRGYNNTVVTSEDYPYAGSGIRLSGNSFHVSINVHEIRDVEKGFDITPDWVKAVGRAGIQYYRIEFQHIKAKFCFFIDVYTKTHEYDPDKDGWFNECYILGGQLTGWYGIYMVNQPDGWNRAERQMDGLVFQNIGFEDLSRTALRICNVSGCKFLNLRMMESLSETYPWIYLRDAEFSDITLKGKLNTSKLNIDKTGRCRGLTIETWVEDRPGGYYARFNRLYTMPLPQKKPDGTIEEMPKLIASTSMQPYNMAKTVKAVRNIEDGTIVPTTTYTLDDLLPLNYGKQGSIVCEFDVLPRTINAIVDRNNNLLLDLRGASRFAPAVMDICAYIEDSGALSIKSDGYVIPLNSDNTTFKEWQFEKTGLYRLTWDTDWNIIVSEIHSEIP